MATITYDERKTNERPGVRAQLRHARFSAYKAREVLDLIRDEPVDKALEILQFTERDPAIVIGKCLASAIANAEHNDALPADELFVSACYADEGPTLKRWRPRARGRATPIRKRTCHITVIVSRFSDDQLRAIRRRDDAKAASSGGRSRGRDAAASRRRRVARSKGEEETTETPAAADAEVDAPTDEVVADETTTVDDTTTVADETTTVDDTSTDEATTDDAVTTEEAVSDDAASDDDTTDDDSTDEAEAVDETVEEAADEAADADSDTEEQH